MKFILWGTIAALLAFSADSEGIANEGQDNELDD
jgi:hypothetical protein